MWCIALAIDLRTHRGCVSSYLANRLFHQSPYTAHRYQTLSMGVARMCPTDYDSCMTMLSFRVNDSEAHDVQIWAKKLGVDKSQILREALHRHLIRLGSEVDAGLWVQTPHSTDEMALAEIADWGVAEDWVDWADEAR